MGLLWLSLNSLLNLYLKEISLTDSSQGLQNYLPENLKHTVQGSPEKIFLPNLKVICSLQSVSVNLMELLLFILLNQLLNKNK